jgi:hypothetical protein
MQLTAWNLLNVPPLVMKKDREIKRLTRKIAQFNKSWKVST